MKEGKYKEMVVAGDFQVDYHDRKLLVLFKEFLKYTKPDVLVLNGDFLDCYEISDFDKSPKVRRPIAVELAIGHRILAEFRDILPKSDIYLIEGNHEYRLPKYIMRNAPELAQIAGVTLPELLELDKLNIKWIATNDEASKWSGVHIQFGQLYIGHFNKVSQHSGQTARALVERYGVSILQNHTHRGGMYYKRTLDGRQLVGIENYAMCQMKLPYDSFPNWQQGWTVIKFKESGRFQPYPIHVVGYKFWWGDKEFKLPDDK